MASHVREVDTLSSLAREERFCSMRDELSKISPSEHLDIIRQMQARENAGGNKDFSIDIAAGSTASNFDFTVRSTHGPLPGLETKVSAAELDQMAQILGKTPAELKAALHGPDTPRQLHETASANGASSVSVRYECTKRLF